MNFSLGTHFEDYVRTKVESGRYNNASEVVREALRLHEEQEAVREARLQRLKAEIAKGLDSGDAEPSTSTRSRQRRGAALPRRPSADGAHIPPPGRQGRPA